MMRLSFVVAAALAMLTDIAHAGPKQLSDSELSDVAAGLFDVYVVMPVIVVNNNNNSTNVANNSPNTVSNAISNITVDNVINISPTDTLTSAAPIILGSTPSITAPVVQMSASGQASNSAPVWVPWAAELRGALGVK